MIIERVPALQYIQSELLYFESLAYEAKDLEKSLELITLAKALLNAACDPDV
jgi:hypothetical protein